MVMSVLLARDTGTDYVIRVHLDDAKLAPDPTLPPPGTDAQGDPLPDTRPLVPDPAWVAEWRWGKQPPAGVTATAYRAMLRNEAKALAGVERTKRQAVASGDGIGTALSFEGQTL